MTASGGTEREQLHLLFRNWLRRDKIRTRDQFTPEAREELSRQVVAQILSAPEFRQAKTVMLYRATRGEVRLEALEHAPETAGKRLVYPFCTSNTEMAALLPGSADAWRSGYCGIEEPIPEQSAMIPPEELDLVLCPCTVFDQAGNRMGMGAGFYDRYLTRCGCARIAAVAFEAQKTPWIPTDPWDYPMDLIFTENKTWRFSTDAGKK